MALQGWAIELLGEKEALKAVSASLPKQHHPHIEIYTDPTGEHFLLRDPKFDLLADANAIRAEAMLCLSDLLGAWGGQKNRDLLSVDDQDPSSSSMQPASLCPVTLWPWYPAAAWR